MTDVVEIAKERRIRLAAEIVKLDEFVLMAERLVKYTPLKSNKGSDADDERAAKSASPRSLRSVSEASDEEAKG